MQSAKDIAASAKAGMDKTKAKLQEKAERLTAHDPMQKEMATEKEEAKIHEAERRKLQEKEHNAAVTHGTGIGHTTTTGTDYTAEGMGGGVGHHHGHGTCTHHHGHGTRTTGTGGGGTY